MDTTAVQCLVAAAVLTGLTGIIGLRSKWSSKPTPYRYDYSHDTLGGGLVMVMLGFQSQFSTVWFGLAAFLIGLHAVHVFGRFCATSFNSHDLKGTGLFALISAINATIAFEFWGIALRNHPTDDVTLLHGLTNIMLVIDVLLAIALLIVTIRAKRNQTQPRQDSEG